MATKLHRELYSTHAEYDPLLNEKLQLLYKGGFDIRKKADLFLKQIKGIESPQAYRSRLECVAYIPYLSEFITQFSSSLFSESLEVKAQGDASDTSTEGDDMEDDFYKQFLESCDQERRSLHQFAQCIMETALSELCVYVSLDFPKGERYNRAQEKADGLDRGYVCTVPYNNVIDWKIDPATGKFIWVKEFEECFPDDNPLMLQRHYFQFKIRTMKPGKNGNMYGAWDIWKSPLMPLDKTYDDKTKYTLALEEGVITSFKEINLWKQSINKAYHVGQQIGSLCEEHYQRRSFMVSNSNKTCVSIGFVTLGPEIGAPGDGIPADIDVPQTSTDVRKRLESDGWIVGRTTKEWSDKIEIVEAKGESHKFIAEELKHLVEAMMQTLRQMNMTANANTKAVGRSAASKMVDQHGTSMLLSVYERYVKDFVKLLVTCLAEGRGENINFAVEGLSISEPSFERKDFVDEVVQLKIDVMKFPDIWKHKYLNKVAGELIDNDMTDKERLEIEEDFQELIDSGKFEPVEMDANGKPMQPGGQSSNSSSSSDKNDDPIIGKSGSPQLPPGSNLQTGEHIEPKIVYDKLKKDYKPKDLEWVKSSVWRGPVEVNVSDIDFAGEDDWRANKPGAEGTDKVEKFSKEMADRGFTDFQPVVLANMPQNDEKYTIIDGRHRVKAAQKVGLPVLAYIADVGSMDSDTPHMQLHSKQQSSGASSS